MRIILTGDIHNGLPGKLTDCIWSMEVIRRYAEENNIEHVIVCGDLFHDRVSLGIEVLNAAYNQLKRCRESGQSWICFPGNHDLYLKNSWEINSLHILGEIVKLVEEVSLIEIDGRRFHILPFIHYESNYMEQLNKLQVTPDDILLTHIGVCGASLNECFLLKNWSIVTFEQTKFKRVFAGHFHCHQTVGKLIYPGSPIPFRFDEGLAEHGFLVYDTETDGVEFIQIYEVGKKYSNHRPPDFLTIPDEDLLRSIELATGNNLRIQLSRDYTSNELAELKNILIEKKGAKSVSWMLPRKEIDLSEQTKISEMETPSKILGQWIQQDDTDIDHELLLELFKQIEQEANERIVVEEDEEC